MRNLAVFALTALLGLALAQKPLEYPVSKPFGASLPLRAGAKERAQLSLAGGSSELRVYLSNRTQSITVGTLNDGFEPQGAVLVADFNFDGWLDLAVPMAVGYGGVNYFYEIYFFDPRARSFELLGVPGEYDGQFCNPKISRAEKALLTECKSGPAYSYADYRFAGGKPYVYRFSAMFPLGGFKKDDVVFATKLYDSKGRLVRALWNDDPRDNRAARRAVAQKRLYLYPAPDPKAKPNGYVVRGDKVEILGVNESDYSWVQIAYQSRAVGRIVRWVHLP